MASCPRLRPPRSFCRRAVLPRSYDAAALILKSVPEIKNRCSLWAVLEGFFASIPKFGPEIKNRCTQEGVNGEILASIPKSGPEIKNRCTKEGVNRQNHALIFKSGPEIKNRCTQKVVFGEILASIPKSGLEIKNRCTQEGVPAGFPELAEYHTAKKRAPHLRERLSAVRTRLELATPPTSPLIFSKLILL